ncbi:Proteasome activator subunit [Sesamum angolense]|uniref:Proteasome activator subunit n=1 Tax=Sesamum angolense TaxID=2727404 RepID=A0AAE1WSG3_9LAMI|nr:Proteasome activator subunit [Sesamum angolense]
MHLYNAWLPPPVAEETKKEKEAFAGVVKSVQESYNPGDPESVYATLKWVSVIDLFVKAKSELSIEDVSTIVEVGLELFRISEHKLHAQVVIQLDGEHSREIVEQVQEKVILKGSVEAVIQYFDSHTLYKIDGFALLHGLKCGFEYSTCQSAWSIKCLPFYIFKANGQCGKSSSKRNTGPEGWRLRQRHFETVTSLVRSCRRFFPPGSASEIWSEFRSLMENPWHNASFEGAGFVRLFLPTNFDNQEFFSTVSNAPVSYHWGSIPNCQFWNSQWASVTARVIKSYSCIDWEVFLPDLFNIYLNMFEVPVANGGGSYPFSIDVPRNTRFLFANRNVTPSKAIAKSIVYLLRPGSSAQKHFEKLANLLEQYYHPSNGGRWTYSLEQILFHLVNTFQKRLQHEQLNKNVKEQSELFLAQSDRISFVNTVLKLIDRGQYSKSDQLSETVAAATSILSYVEPSLVLPFLANRFHMALETMTATHQLKSAVTSIAFAGRSLFFASLSGLPMDSTSVSGIDSFSDLLMISLSNTLLGMDANDPPKTLATMQLIGSLFSNMSTLDDNVKEGSLIPSFHFSEWLDEFLYRLFSLLQHLEPSSVLTEGVYSPTTSGTFLVEDGPYYFCMLEILLGRLSDSLYKQALKKISKFVTSNILPGAIAEVGLLCCACVHSNPQEAVVQLIKPILDSLISSLKATPTTGFGNKATSDVPFSRKEKKSTLSPALEIAIEYQLKVNGAGDHVLRSLLGSLVHYYPIDHYKCVMHHSFAPSLEEWIDTKDFSIDKPVMAPRWHVPVEDEISFANELLKQHFESALDDLLMICQSKIHSDPGNEKDHLKVTLLRVDSSLQGVLSCLPDFRPSSENGMVKEAGCSPFLIAGATGSCVGSSELREKAADVIHETCKYLLKEKSDDSIFVATSHSCYGYVRKLRSEYEEWSNHRQSWKLESAAIIEPPINFIVSSHSKGKRRPRWALVDKAYMHNTWRSSQSSYHLFRTSGNVFPSKHVVLLMDDLLNLSLQVMKLFEGEFSNFTCCKIHPEDDEKMAINHIKLCANSSWKPEESKLARKCSLSSHNESQKAQKAITELFVKYNIHFAGLSRSIFRESGTDGTDFADLVAEIGSMSFENTNLHWRYNLMANRVLLLLAMASRNDPNVPTKVLSEIAEFDNFRSLFEDLKSQLPQTRILAISALNTLLKESPYKFSAEKQRKCDVDTTPSRGHYGSASLQSFADKSITRFYFDFSASWPRTPSWISLFGSDTFYPNFARIFKRLIQECGMSVILALRNALEEFVDAKERSKQCVAAEVFAGVLHSDVLGVSEAWDSWMVVQLQNIIHAPSVESIPEWAASIRYAVTGKGKSGTRAPLLRHKVLDCLMKPLPQTVTTSVVAKRYTLLSAVLIEVSPLRMPGIEILVHYNLLEELLSNMSHSSAQVREAIGVALSVLCSNLRLCASFGNDNLFEGEASSANIGAARCWDQHIVKQASELVPKIQNASASETLEILTEKN